jgi:hypothetical protein
MKSISRLTITYSRDGIEYSISYLDDGVRSAPPGM